MGKRSRWLLGICAAVPLAVGEGAAAQTPPAPQVVDPALAVRTVASGLAQPISMAFLRRDDMFVLEKASGQVKRVVGGEVRATVLDLAVNSASERGLLGIAPHPRFRRNGYVYLFWTESRSGADSTDLADVRVLANRIDRFEWDGEALRFDRSILRFRSFQADANQPPRGNHIGGVLRFGPDGKLYAIVGDTGRRGRLQNLVNGPFGPGLDDDRPPGRARRLLRAPAGPLAADEHRRHARRGARTPVPAARRRVQRSRAELEVRGRAGRHRLRARPPARRRVRGRPRHGRLDRAPGGRAPVPHPDRRRSRRRRHDRSAARRRRRRQPPQVGPDGEREPALRAELRGRHRRADRPGRLPLRRVAVHRHGVRGRAGAAPGTRPGRRAGVR